MRLAMTCIVRPQRAEVLCQRLLESGLVEELTAVEVRGYGRQKGHLESYAGDEYHLDVLPKVAITGVLEANQLTAVGDLICTVTRTGRIGDGKVFFRRIDGEAEW